MSGSLLPRNVAEWIAQRRAQGVTDNSGDPAANARQRLNSLNIRQPGKPENPGNPSFQHSTDRLTNSSSGAILNHMVEQRLDATFAALADPTRRGMLADLMLGEKSVGELAAPHAMSFAGAAKHVATLERAGLIERRRAGRQQRCRLRPSPLEEAEAFLKQYERFWTERLDTLEALIKQEKDDG